MVVDAMRSDFVFSDQSQMAFVHSLINKGHLVGFTLFSNPPTVTLPRLKGITTGSTPSFLDAILNIAEDDTSSTLGDQDSWIRQLVASDKKIHMFGDDTWIKLFPRAFSSKEGTSSFYVSDFTEVDLNVTRHISAELAHDSWDCLILHYLGLDHIGHKGGPESANMPIKQREMDDVIASLYTYVEKNPDTLLVVLGDHGMNEVGNHGGSSIGETSAGLLFISSKFPKIFHKELPLPWNDGYHFYEKIQQIDLVPTLATLLGFPIPKNNLGIFIQNFKPLFSEKQYSRVLLENALQLKDLVENYLGVTFETLLASNNNDLKRFAQLWSLLQKTQDQEHILEFLTAAQSKLAESATNYNYKDIASGLALFMFASIIFIFAYIQASLKSQSFIMSSYFALLSVLISFSSFGSSLIEEEYQIWWWFTSVSVTALIIHLKPPKLLTNIVSVLFLLRIIRGWNNSGQKFNLLSNLKIGKWLEDNDYNVDCIFIFYGSLIFYIFRTNGVFMILQDYQIFAFIPIFTVISFSLMAKLITCFIQDEISNASKFNPVLMAIINWPKQMLEMDDYKKCLNPIYHLFYYTLLAILALRLVWGFTNYQRQVHLKTFFSDFANLTMFFLLNQTSPKNVLIFSVLLVLRYLMSRVLSQSLFKSKTENLFRIALILTSFNIFVQNFTFFSMGNTNSLSTVDLTNGFNGLAEYDLFLCGLLTFTANWAGPIFWSLGNLILLHEGAPYLRAYKYDLLYYKVLISMVFYSFIGMGLLLACYSLRFHLFIWTVFSPKLLFFASWYLFMNLGVDFIFTLLLISFY